MNAQLKRQKTSFVTSLPHTPYTVPSTYTSPFSFTPAFTPSLPPPIPPPPSLRLFTKPHLSTPTLPFPSTPTLPFPPPLTTPLTLPPPSPPHHPPQPKPPHHLRIRKTNLIPLPILPPGPLEPLPLRLPLLPLPRHHPLVPPHQPQLEVLYGTFESAPRYFAEFGGITLGGGRQP